MKVALIGSNGQLGHDIKATWDWRETIPLTRAELDVTDRAQTLDVLRAHEPDLIVNTAAFTRVDDCESQPGAAFAVNTLGVLHVAQAAQALGAELLHISTDYVFSGESDRPYRESDHASPVNVYGASKLAGEVLVRLSCERHYVVRSSGLYGVAGSSSKGGNFVETMLRLAREGRELRVVDDQVLTPTHTVDLAHGLYQLVESGRYGTYHLTNAGSCSWYQFAARIFALANIDADVKPTTSAEYSAQARRPAYSVLDNAAAHDAGVTPLRSWEEALGDYLWTKGHLDAELVPLRPRISPLERELLSLATEDWYALWEIYGTIRQMSPELPEDEALGRARGTTEWLFEQGLIHLNRGYSNNRIPPPEVEVVIADRENWMATEHDQVFTFNATPKGERLYFTLPREG